MTDHARLRQLRDGDRRVWLGRLAWFAVLDANVPHATVAASLNAAGLSEFTPPPPCDDDVFRRVWRNGQRRQVDTARDGVKENLLVREVARAGGKIMKKLVVETVNSKGEKLSFRQVADVRFDTDTPDDVLVTWHHEHVATATLAAELAADYERLRGHVNGNAVRAIIRSVLDSGLAISVRPGGGVYFVAEERSAGIEALEAAINPLPGCSLHSLPLIDDRRQREMLRAAYEAETIGEIDRTIDELIDLANADQPISPAKFTSLNERRQQLVDKTNEYSALLGNALQTTATRLDIYGREMSRLLGKVKKAS